MENRHQQHQQEGKFHPRLPQKKSAPLPNALQEECLSGSCPFQTRVWECCYLKNDINRLERVQRSVARFITGDYKSRHEGCVTNMLTDLDLPSIVERLTFLYKVVKGHVPAINIEHYLRAQRPKRTIRAKHFEDFVKKT